MIDISKGSIHDAKIMESIIDNKLNNNKKPFNLVGYKDYIKNITLITPLWVNLKKNNIINNDNKKLLNERYTVEQFF